MEQPSVNPVGMADVARVAGVAVSTVSRALSGASGVSPRRREQILQIARRIGYLASTGDETNTDPGSARVAAVIPDADRWVFGSILSGLQDVLRTTGVGLTVHQGSSGAERAQIAGSSRLFSDSDVVVLVPLPRGVPNAELARLRDRLVVAGSVVPGIASAGIDDLAVGEKATNYLLNLGHQRIAFAAGADHEGTRGHASLRRGEGFAKAMTQAGLDPSRQVIVPFGAEAGRLAAEELLQGRRLPEAIFASSDEMAAGLIAVFRRAGIRIPEDLAIIGVDDHPVAELIQLTTIAQPARAQGQAAAKMVLQLLAGGPVPEPLTIATRLVVRETTRRADPN